MMKKIMILAVLALLALGGQAKVRLPHILCNNMVLQQNTQVRLWGWAKAGSQISVTTSWNTAKLTTKADRDGRWMLKVQTPEASYTPQTIKFDDGDGAVELSNVLMGEVWVCAGQSNMEMPMKGFGNCPVEGYNEEVIAARNYRGIHYVKIPSEMRVNPQDDAQCEWKEIDASTIGEASATGYFFAQTVNRALDVPVGLIMANKGGTRVESWLTKENLEKYTN